MTEDLLEASWYSGMAAILATAASGLGWPISLGLVMGSAACSSNVLARPSQNCFLLYRAFKMVGALRWPTRPLKPTEVGLPSVKARSGSWQEAQATVPSADRRESKNSFIPRAIFSGVGGLSAGISAMVCRSGTPSCWGERGWANGPGTGTGESGVGSAATAPGDAALFPGSAPGSILTPAQVDRGDCHRHPKFEVPSTLIWKGHCLWFPFCRSVGW